MKHLLKEIARYLLYLIKRKPYNRKFYNNVVIKHIRETSYKEYFYGYYDKSPEHNGKVLFHEMNNDHVTVIVKDLINDLELVVGKSKAYNWQLGTRAQWIDDDTIAYNDFDGSGYISRLYSLKKGEIVKSFEKPIQDYSKKGYFLGVNYQRLRSYAKEYGYYCLPELSNSEFDDYENDGIWKIDKASGEITLLLTIKDVQECEPIARFKQGKHFVNHIMICPNGEAFIFIHRYYVGKERYDRLMYYDFNELKCLFSDKLQSHYCWLGNTHVFGYGGYHGKNEFHTVDVKNGKVEICKKLTEIHPKDGHPTKYGDWVVVDSYPYYSRMQELVAFNLKTNDSKLILEVFHDMKHRGYDRCDLHPRFSEDGKRIYFDSLYSGKRQLCSIDVSHILF